MLKKTCLLLFLACSSLLLSAQELGLFNMQEVWEVNKINPAIFPENKFVVALPSPYYNFHNNALTFDNVLADQGNGDYTVEPDQFLDLLAGENSMRADVDFNTFAFQYRMKKLALGINHAVRFRGKVDYPETLIRLFAQGNAQYVGEEVEFGPEINLQSYQVFGLTAAYEFTDFLTAGIRLNYLVGMGDISTQKSSTTIYTDDDIYEIALATDMVYQSAAYIDYDSTFNLNSVGFDIKNNAGIAADFGVNIKPVEKLNIALSLLDVGAITWNHKVKTFTSQQERTFEAEEIDLTTLWSEGTLTFQNENENLNFNEIFDFQDEAAPDYKTVLPKKLYAAATYQLDKAVQVSGVYLADIENGKANSAFAIGGQAQLLRFLSLGATYAIRNKENNLGLNLLLKLGPVRLFAATDDAIAVFTPYSSRASNLRLGLNLAFGKTGVKVPEVLE